MKSKVPFEIRRAADRGGFTNEWLDARFSFSFGAWHDPSWQRFGPVLAINEDKIQPGKGFAMHPHADLEILMLPRSGRIEHHDDLGGHAIVAPGELHVMRAGWGIRHSQMNPSAHEVDHHYQIWLAPRTGKLTPRVRTLRLPPPISGEWIVLASGLGAGGADIDVDATVSWGSADAAKSLSLSAMADASRYLHVMSGSLTVEGIGLQAGDALVQRDEVRPLTLKAITACELLCFDLPNNP
jgi:quercetin 2,3-dioxygenase